MAYLKKLGVSFLYSSIVFLSVTFLITLFNFFDIFGGGFLTFLMIFDVVVSIFIGAFMIGKKYSKKGWLEGFKFSFLMWIIVFIFDIFVYKFRFSLKFVIFSIILLVSGIFGGMVGINFRHEK